jgi:hypothetical protein
MHLRLFKGSPDNDIASQQEYTGKLFELENKKDAFRDKKEV